MKGYAMLGIGKTGWIEKERPLCGPLDAIVLPIAVSPCTSDVHTVWEGAIGDRHNMILGHEAVGEVVEVGALVRDFKCGDRVIIPAITPDWGALESQAGYSMHSGGMLAGWKFSNFKDGVFAEFFHVTRPMPTWLTCLRMSIRSRPSCWRTWSRRASTAWSWPMCSSAMMSASSASARSA